MDHALRWPLLCLDNGVILARLSVRVLRVACAFGRAAHISHRYCCFQPIAAAADGVGDCPSMFWFRNVPCCVAAVAVTWLNTQSRLGRGSWPRQRRGKVATSRLPGKLLGGTVERGQAEE